MTERKPFQPYSPEDRAAKMAEIIDFMSKQRLPFITLSAEACSLSRSTMKLWLKNGENGEEPWASFRLAVYAIRAKAAFALAEEMMNCGDSPGERAALKSKELLLQKLSREDFDPPKEVYERVKYTGVPSDLAQIPATNPRELEAEAMEVLQLPPGTIAKMGGTKL